VYWQHVAANTLLSQSVSMAVCTDCVIRLVSAMIPVAVTLVEMVDCGGHCGGRCSQG
jgi:hypothetical protein